MVCGTSCTRGRLIGALGAQPLTSFKSAWVHGHGQSGLADVGGDRLSALRRVSRTHRRRMEREAKAQVVASVWGQIFFNSLPR